jgi:hypothetical protein
MPRKNYIYKHNKPYTCISQLARFIMYQRYLLELQWYQEVYN